MVANFVQDGAKGNRQAQRREEGRRVYGLNIWECKTVASATIGASASAHRGFGPVARFDNGKIKHVLVT